MVATIHFQKNFICHLREKFLITAGYQSLTFPHSLVVRIRSNVYNKSNHIAQTEPVFLRLAFMTFYPTREINQASRNPAVVCFFYTSSRSRDYFYNCPTTEADMRHNKGNRHLA